MWFRGALSIVLFAPFAVAQERSIAGGANVRGVVHDSVASAPLRAAIVQLVLADSGALFSRTVHSDSAGHFTIDSVPDGRYMLGFFHPMVDSLGLEPIVREVFVEGGRPVRADLAIPSPGRLRYAICGLSPESGAVVVGVVRDARHGTPIAAAKVSAEWLEYTFTPTGVARRIPRAAATTRDNGWFYVCNVPNGGTITLVASQAGDSTGFIDVQIPASGFLRRELYLGRSVTATVADGVAQTDTLRRARRRPSTGDARVSGSVVTALGGQPLEGAQVSIAGGPRTHANERGEWTLVDAPTGTWMIEIRAVGYYPERRRVDIVSGAPPVRVALSTLKSVLDTVKVTAARPNDRNIANFHERRRTGIGQYLMPSDVEKRHPLTTSDLFRLIAGVRLELDTSGMDRRITMRGAAIDAWCHPAIFVDGHQMNGLTADDIDGWVRPEEIAGIEIYNGTTVPVQFLQRYTGGAEDPSPCGSILIWKK